MENGAIDTVQVVIANSGESFTFDAKTTTFDVFVTVARKLQCSGILVPFPHVVVENSDLTDDILTLDFNPIGRYHNHFYFISAHELIAVIEKASSDRDKAIAKKHEDDRFTLFHKIGQFHNLDELLQYIKNADFKTVVSVETIDEYTHHHHDHMQHTMRSIIFSPISSPVKENIPGTLQMQNFCVSNLVTPWVIKTWTNPNWSCIKAVISKQLLLLLPNEEEKEGGDKEEQEAALLDELLAEFIPKLTLLRAAIDQYCTSNNAGLVKPLDELIELQPIFTYFYCSLLAAVKEINRHSNNNSLVANMNFVNVNDKPLLKFEEDVKLDDNDDNDIEDEDINPSNNARSSSSSLETIQGYGDVALLFGNKCKIRSNLINANHIHAIGELKPPYYLRHHPESELRFAAVEQSIAQCEAVYQAKVAQASQQKQSPPTVQLSFLSDLFSLSVNMRIVSSGGPPVYYYSPQVYDPEQFILLCLLLMCDLSMEDTNELLAATTSTNCPPPSLSNTRSGKRYREKEGSTKDVSNALAGEEFQLEKKAKKSGSCMAEEEMDVVDDAAVAAIDEDDYPTEASYLDYDLDDYEIWQVRLAWLRRFMTRFNQTPEESSSYLGEQELRLHNMKHGVGILANVQS